MKIKEILIKKVLMHINVINVVYGAQVTDVIIKNALNSNYLKIIENAKEVYCLDSAWAWLIELMNIGDSSKNYLDLDQKFYHRATTKSVFRETTWTYVTNETSPR